MIRKTFFFLISSLFLIPLRVWGFQVYRWPTNASKFITSTFGETRERRFHTGFDVKTWGRNGYKVFAVDDGYVWRMRVSPWGYGKALYLKLRDGNYAVYGHLLRFNSLLEKAARSEQLAAGKYSFDKFFGKDEIIVKKGDVIAYTGYTGTQFPHLHFEIRDPGNKPLNPLQFGLKSIDRRAPVISKIAFSPMNVNSLVNGDWKPFIVRVKKINNHTYIFPDTVTMWGDVGVAVSTYDVTGETANKFCPYRMRLVFDDSEIFKVTYNKLDFTKNHLVVLDRDYALAQRTEDTFMNLYVDEKNTLDIYHPYRPGDGIISFNRINYSDKTFELKTEIADFDGNTSSLTGYVRIEKPGRFRFTGNVREAGTLESTPEFMEEFTVKKDFYRDFLRLQMTASYELLKPPEITVFHEGKKPHSFHAVKCDGRTYTAAFKLTQEESGMLSFLITGKSEESAFKSEFDINLHYVKEGTRKKLKLDELCTVTFYPNSLFRDIWIRKNIVENNNITEDYKVTGKLCEIYPQDVPLNGGVTLTLGIPDSAQRKSKLGIYAYDDKWSFTGSTVDTIENTISTSITSFGLFGILEDSEPPEISRIIPSDGSSVSTDKPLIRIYLKDELSGIGSDEDIAVYLDGEKVIAEYAPPRNLVTYRPFSPLRRGRHTLRVTVMDNLRNREEKVVSFMVTGEEE